MKNLILSSTAKALLGIVVCAAMFAFKSPIGAHSVQIYFDSKLMVEQYVGHKSSTPKLTLDPAANYQQMIVKYSECGRTVSGRKIALKDDNNKLLKEWRFDGSSTGFEGSMECPVKEILAFKQKSNTLKLYYSSNDFPDGSHFADLVIANATSASKGASE